MTSLTGFSQTALTSVACDEASVAGEVIDRQTAVVAASSASRHRCMIFERLDLIDREHGCFGRLRFMTFLCNKCRAKSTHDTGDIGADGLAVSDLLEAAQYSLVIECSTLQHNMLAQSGGIRHFDDFEKGVFDDRLSKPGRDISDSRAFFLCLLHFGIHKDGTAGAQIDRVFREERFMGKILD